MSPAIDPSLHAAVAPTARRTQRLENAYRVTHHRRAARSVSAGGPLVRAVVR